MDEPRICVIGAGNLSTRRIYPYLGAAGARLAGVCDLDREKAVRNARLFGGRAYADAAAMVDDQEPDAVLICVGPEQHAELAQEMLRRGIPVYTEKPPAPNAAEALEVARTSHMTGVLCTTAFKKRYTAAADAACKWLTRFPREDWLSISADYASGAYPNTSPRTSFLLDFGLHMIDLAAYLFGEVAEVFAFASGMHAYAVSLRFAHGGVGVMNLNDGRSFTVPTEELELTVSGGNFMTIHNSAVWRMTSGGEPSGWREPPTFTSAGDSGFDTGHLAEIIDFLGAVRECRTTRSNIYESYKSMVLYEAILASVETCGPVNVRYESPG